jgi:hypothetical protein
MSTFADALHAHANNLHHLTPAMESFVGKPIASRREVLDAITTFAKECDLYTDTYTIRPNLLLAMLLSSPRPIHIKDLNSRIARHMTAAT